MLNSLPGDQCSSPTDPTARQISTGAVPESARETSPQRLSRRFVAVLDRFRLDYAYLCLALIAGLCMVLLTPPFQNPDEPSHYHRAWSLAEGQLMANDDSTVVIPTAVAELPEALGSSMVDWSQNSYSSATARRLLGQPIGAERSTVFSSAGAAGPIGYLPAIAAIEMTRVVGRSPLAALYLARLLNLAAATLLTFLAIRMAPFGKLLFALAALLPMTVAQYASLSPDALAISGAFLFASLVLYYAQKKSLSGRDIALLAATGAVLLNAKQGSEVLALLVFLIPLRVFSSVKRYVVSVLAVLGSAVVIGLIPLLIAPSDTEAIRRLWGPGFEGDPSAQTRFVLDHPWGFTKVLGTTLHALTFRLFEQAGGTLGWLTVFLPQMILLVLLVLLALLFSYRDAVSLSAWQRSVLAIVAGVYIVAVMAALYVGWSPLHSPVVTGLQGRYFIAVLPLALLSVYRLPPGRRLVFATLVILGAAGAVLTVIAMLQFYYL